MKNTYKFFRGITLLCFLFSMTTFSQTFTGTGGSIPDSSCGAGSLFPLTVSGVVSGASLNEVTINIAHTWDADLDVFLLAPNGAAFELTTDNGSSGDNYVNTHFTASAATAITAGSAPFTGNFLPEGSFASVSGQTNGTWTLRVCDDASGDTGTLGAWSITFGAPPPATYCNSVPTSHDGSGITNLVLGTTSFPISLPPRYVNLTASPVTVQQGQNVNTQITFNTSIYDYRTHIWIDFNDDTVFDASERVYSGTSSTSSPNTLNATFPLSGSATLGSHRLRIGAADSGQATPNPCYSGGYGVTIDATIEIVEPICTSADLGTSTVNADCGSDRYYVNVNIINANNAVEFSDGTNTFPVTGAGVNQVGPFPSGSSVSLTLVHTEAVCNIDLGSFSFTCPPPNDLCSGALDITCGSSVSGSTTAASNEASLASCNGLTINTAPGVWYSLEGTGGDILLSTADSSFDTKLAVFTGSCSGLVCVDSDDDDGPGLTSELIFSSTMGQRYYVYLTGFLSNSGAYNLTVECICEGSFDDNCNTVYSGYAPASSTQITAIGQYGLAPYTYALSDGQVNNTGVFTVAPTSTTVYEVTITDSAGCISTSQTTVVVADVQCGNGGNQSKVIVCHNGNEICISPNAVQAHLNHGDSLGSCGITTCETLPICDARLKVPGPAATDVDTDIILSWGAATGYVQGYLLSIGTTPGGTDVLNSFDVGDTLSYDPSGLDYGTTYYVTVVPYNNNGPAMGGCFESYFTTEDSPWCAQSTSISCGQALAGNTNNGMINSYLASCNGSTINDAPGVWYTFEGTGDDINASTCVGTGFDTIVAVFSGSCAGIECVSANDDGCSLQSSVDFTSVIGTTYYIYVTPYSTSSSNPGPFTLTLTCTAPPPPPQACADAIGVSCNSSVTGSTVGYDSNDLDFCGTSLNAGPGRFYKLEGTGSSITVSTCNPGTDFDTKLGVFRGSCSALICVAGNDDFSGTNAACVIPATGSTFNRASTVTFNSVAGQTYYVYVTGFSSAAGNFELSISCAGVPPQAGVVSDPAGWSLYPNPSTNGEVQLNLTNYINKDLNIQMMDFSGKLLINNSETNLQSPRYNLKTQSMSNGLYFVRIVTESGTSTKKLIIAN